MTITEFLLERIDDDEWQAEMSLGNRMPQSAEDEVWSEAVARRVLAESLAKRVITYEHRRAEGEPWQAWRDDYCITCADWDDSEVGEGPPGVAYPCDTLKALAAVYADHPDYRQEWVIG